MNYIRIFADRWRTSLRHLLAVCFICAGCGVASAETFTLGIDGMRNAVQEVSYDKGVGQYATEFSEGDSQWRLEISWSDNESLKINPFVYKDTYLYIRNESKWSFTDVVLSTDRFKGKVIKEITIEANLYINAKVDAEQTITVLSDNEEVAATSFAMSQKQVTQAPEVSNLTINKVIDGDLIVCFSAPSGGEFAFKSIVVEYDDEALPEISRREVVAAGHRLEFDLSDPTASVYYTIDGSDNWLDYDPEIGIVFNAPGIYTLKYYASTGSAQSVPVSEDIEVVRPSGLYAAMAANDDITVSGVICSRGNGYVLIGNNEDAEIDGQLALETADYPALQQAALGSKVTVRGRPTDRFGREVKALGSLSDVTINSTPSVPTSVVETKSALRESEINYDVAGRRIAQGQPSRRTICISTNGEKKY